MSVKIYPNDCLDVLRGMPDASVDSIVTDPPYGLSFMGKRWDYDVPSEEMWRECLRVLKPGAHLLAFAGTRTQHRMAVRIEDAGFEIRDMIAWVYGSGFPKSLDVSKAIDKSAGAEREVIGTRTSAFGDAETSDTGDGRNLWCKPATKEVPLTGEPATDAAKQWDGWGTALKPALEPITVARKPLGEKTVAANVLAHGTGAINVDGCRVGTSDKLGGGMENGTSTASDGWDRPWRRDPEAVERNKATTAEKIAKAEALGRWPANLIHDGSDEVVGLFPQTGVSAGGRSGHTAAYSGGFKQEHYGDAKPGFGDSGSAARFFYCAKASKKDRDEGCDALPERREGAAVEGFKDGSLHAVNKTRKDQGPSDRQPSRNHHPTVKPTALMRYLCRLVTPPGGTVLDPFMGSGSTGKAAVLEGFNFIGIEREAEYVEIAKARIESAEAERGEMLPFEGVAA
jgi:site-specific DNA-methyltransferase (adenine-specific)